MATRKQVEQGLKDVGACWAVRSDKYVSANDDWDAKPTYHVHPDAAYPHERNIKRFESLDAVWSWVQACKRSADLHAQDGRFHEVIWTGSGYEVAE